MLTFEFIAIILLTVNKLSQKMLTESDWSKSSIGSKFWLEEKYDLRFTSVIYESNYKHSKTRAKNQLQTRGQFHQHSTRSFYVRKLHAQLFCAHVLGLYFTGVSLLAEKLLVECWWNWAQVPTTTTEDNSYLNFKSWCMFERKNKVDGT